MLRSALENIIRNAIQHSPSDSPIEIGLTDASDVVTIVIRDRGPGVPEDALPRLTEDYYRVEKTPRTPGLGIGLAIAERVARSHHARLTIANREPGLEVRLELPHRIPDGEVPLSSAV